MLPLYFLGTECIKCIKPARLFVNCILAVFLGDFNGIIKILTSLVTGHNVFVDASLQQEGGIWNKKVYSCDIPQRIKDLASIVQLEAANIMLAAKLWAKNWANCEITVWYDNLAVVHACQSQRIKDNWLMAYCRTLWYIFAKYIKFNVQHIYGVDNVKADILSRWHIYKYSNLQEVKNLEKLDWAEVNSDMLWPNFSV